MTVTKAHVARKASDALALRRGHDVAINRVRPEWRLPKGDDQESHPSVRAL